MVKNRGENSIIFYDKEYSLLTGWDVKKLQHIGGKDKKARRLYYPPYAPVDWYLACFAGIGSVSVRDASFMEMKSWLYRKPVVPGSFCAVEPGKSVNTLRIPLLIK